MKANELIGFPDQIREIFSQLRESEDESLKNKSGYYKGGKFWKASTLWQAVKNKIPQRVPNRYILQECTWNIGTLQNFANEVKNVQEVSLDYPIILDMNGNILDGAHRVVKAYLEGKDIDVVYLGDDEWPEPDYDEEKAVKESKDEKMIRVIGLALTDVPEGRFTSLGTTLKDCLAYLEKQNHDGKKWITPAELNRLETLRYEAGFDDGVRSEMKKQKEQKSIESIAAEVTKDKESAIKFLKSAGIMDDNGELAEMYRSEPKPAENDTRTKIISRATSEKQVVLISESNGSAEIGWDTRSLEDTKKLLEYGLAFINKQLGVKPAEWSEEDIKMLEHIIGQYETGNKNSKVMGYLPRVKELDFLKKVFAKAIEKKKED